VAYLDHGNATKATVMKFDGNNWVTVGMAGFSAGEAASTSLLLDSSNVPYVAYTDRGNGSKATVMKFNGISWVPVGTAGFSAGGVAYTSLALDGSNTPYVAYMDYGNSSKATVMKFNGSNWVIVGMAGFSIGQATYISLALDNSNTPYLAYQDGGNSNKATVMKFNGSSWVTIGTAGFSGGGATFTSLALDSNNTPYVAYADVGNGNKATVMKFDGSNWVIVGTAGFSAGTADYNITLAFDSGNTPYVAYRDVGNSGKATVMKFDGSSWGAVGTAGFSADRADYTSFALDSSNTPYVAYQDMLGNSQRATVMKFVSPSYDLTLQTVGQGTVMGAGSFIAGAPIALTATPNVGSTFVGWSPSPCAPSFIMPANALTCTATFDSAPVNPPPVVNPPSTYVPPPPPPETKVIVSFGGDGKGKVTSNPSGIDCQSPTACNYTFKTRETIQLTPQAIGNSRFQSWGSTCNNGIISASGRTVYCTVYFVDLTPPPVVEVEPEPVVTPEPEPVVEPEPVTPEPVVTPEPEPVAEPEPVVKPEPVVEPVSEPTDNAQTPSPEPELPPTDDTTEPVVEPVIEELPVVEEPVAVTPEPVEVLPPLVSNETCPPKDTLSYYCNAGGQTIGDLNIVENSEATNGVGFLSNAVIVGTVQLADKTWISNLRVTSTGIVVGGVVTGLNTNDGYMGDFVFKGEFIKGGTLGGKILNLSKIFSWFEDVTLTANAHLIGGALKGKIKGDPKNPALLENLRILSGSVVSGVIIGNGVKIDKDVEIEKSIQDDTPADEAELPTLDEQFSAGISINGSSYQNKNVAQILSDNVSMRGRIHVKKNHVGKKVNIFVTVAYRVSEDSKEEFLFTVNHTNGLMPWDGKQKSMGENPFRSGEVLQANHTVKIYDGILLAKGLVKIQFGYILEDGTMVESAEGIALTTTD
jgi:hypothetical protein